MNWRKAIGLIEKHEVRLFYLLVLLNLIPIFSGTYFLTLDGPAHLYNSRLILELIGGSSSTVHQFYQLNELVPNLSGHAIIALFMVVLPAFLAEKAFLVIYAIALPLSFRYLLKTTESANVLFSYFILPFVYSSLFLLGFYNFSISFVFMFLALGYLLKISNKEISIGSIVLLTLLCFLTFTSHLVIYGLLLAFLLAQIGIAYLNRKVNRKNKERNIDAAWIKQLVAVGIANLIPLFFTGVYFFKRPQTGSDYNFISREKRLSYFTDFEPLIAFNYEIELKLTKILFFLFVVLILLACGIIVRKLLVRDKKKTTENGLLVSRLNHPSLLATIICLISFSAFLILPDSDGYGGYISIRMALLFLMFLIYWFATVIPQKWIAAISIPVILYVVFGLNTYYIYVIKSQSPIAAEIVSVSDLIEPNSVVMPVNVSDNWLLAHGSNYLGVEKPMVILENYEANSGYFPVKWNVNRAEVSLTNNEFGECMKGYPLSGDESAFNIDYLFVLGSISNLSKDCQEVLLRDHALYEKIYESPTCVLIKLTDL